MHHAKEDNRVIMYDMPNGTTARQADGNGQWERALLKFVQDMCILITNKHTNYVENIIIHFYALHNIWVMFRYSKLVV